MYLLKTEAIHSFETLVSTPEDGCSKFLRNFDTSLLLKTESSSFFRNIGTYLHGVTLKTPVSFIATALGT
jgi:hypothetical protein